MSGIIAAAGITAAAGLASGAMSSGMLGGGKGGGGVSTQTQQQQLPSGIVQRESDNYDLAMQTANQLMGPYGGQRVANMTPEQINLIQQLYGNVGSGNAAYDRAQGMVNGLAGFNSGQLTPQMLAGRDLSPYMNPYTQGVINPAMQQMEAARKQSLMQIGDQASQARAFGGSRQGIAEGTQNAASELQRGQFTSQLMGQNFLNAQQQAVGDIGRDWQAQTANQAARQYDSRFQSQIASQMGQLADARQNNFLSGITGAMGGQQMLQKQQQDELAAQMAYYNEQKQQPLDVLAIRQNALAQAAPFYGRTSTTTSPGPSTDPWMTGLGTASTVAGLMGTFGKQGLWGSDYGTTSDPRSIASPEALAAWNTSQLK